MPCNCCDPLRWIEKPDPDPRYAGRLRTVCGVCGKYIGHRTKEAAALEAKHASKKLETHG